MVFPTLVVCARVLPGQGSGLDLRAGGRGQRGETEDGGAAGAPALGLNKLV